MSVDANSTLETHELTRLCYWLRGHGLRADTGQLIAAERLLKGLRNPPPASQLGPWLAPIFSSSAADQEAFARVYAEWIGQRDTTTTVPYMPPPRIKTGEEPQVFERVWHWQKWAPVCLFMFLGLLFGVAVFQSQIHVTLVQVTGGGATLADAKVMPSKLDVTVVKGADGHIELRYRRWHLPFHVAASHPSHAHNGKLVEKAILLEQPVAVMPFPLYGKRDLTTPEPTSEVARRVHVVAAPARSRGSDIVIGQERIINFMVVGTCAALIMGSLAWWSFMSLRRRGFLERLPAEGKDKVSDIAAIATPALIAYARDLRYLGREMRRRHKVASRTLDVPATLAVALRAGTMLKLVFGSRAEPEYVMLVDSADPCDHQAHLADEVLGALMIQGISMSRYEFDGDPRFSRHAPLTGRPLHQGRQSLEQLAARHPDARLMIFSDGYGLLDRYTNQPAAWLTCLFSWPSTVLFTPVQRQKWSLREWILVQSGLALLPLDASGLHQLGEVYRQERSFPKVPACVAVRDRPAYLRDVDLLLSRRPLRQNLLDDLMRELNLDLQEDGMAWLAGCAVYPELHWSITLAVGDAVVRGREAQASEAEKLRYAVILAQLSRLPWMRQGYLPDWFRTVLLDGMPSGRHIAVRDSLSRFFAAASTSEQDRDRKPTLGVVLPQTHAWADVVAGFKGIWESIWKRRAERPVREDRVFLRFMSAPSKPLTYGVGEAMMRLFYRHGAPLAGPRLLPVSVALVAALLLAWIAPPVSTFERTRPGDLVEPAPAFVSLSADGRRMMTVNNTGLVNAVALADKGDGQATACMTKQAPGLALSSIGPVYANYVVPMNGGLGTVSLTQTCDVSAEESRVELRKASAYRGFRLSAVPASNVTAKGTDALCQIVEPSAVTQISRLFLNENMLSDGDVALACAVSGDGSRLAIATQRGLLKEFSTIGAPLSVVDRQVRSPGGGAITNLVADTTGKGLVALQDNGNVWLLRDEATTWTLLGPTDARAPLAMSGDGSSVVFATSRREVEMWKIEKARGRNVLLMIDKSWAGIRYVPRLTGALGKIGAALTTRYGFVAQFGEANIKGDDRVVILVNGPESLSAVAVPYKTEPTRLQDMLSEMKAREALVIVPIEKRQSLTPPGDSSFSDNPGPASRVRWIMGLSAAPMEELDTLLRTTETVLPGSMLVSRIRAQAPIPKGGANSIFYVPWPAAGHVGGDFLLVPKKPPVHGTSDNDAVATLSPLSLGQFADNKFYLRQPLAVQFNASIGGSFAFTVPAGFVTSHQSVPAAFWSILPSDGSTVVASVIADYLYWSQMYTREQSDTLFRLTLKSLKVSDAKAAILYNAIRSSGQRAWDEEAKKKREGEQRVMTKLPTNPETTEWSEYKNRPDVFLRPISSSQPQDGRPALTRSNEAGAVVPLAPTHVVPRSLAPQVKKLPNRRRNPLVR